MIMDGLVKTSVAEVTNVIGGMGQYSADPASDGMSVEVRWFPPSHLTAGQRVTEAYALIRRLIVAGFWVADKTSYWSGNISDVLADGQPAWIGRSEEVRA